MDREQQNKIHNAIQNSSILNSEEKSLLLDIIPHWPDNEISNLLEVLGIHIAEEKPEPIPVKKPQPAPKPKPAEPPVPKPPVKPSPPPIQKPKPLPTPPIPEGESISELRHRLEEDTVSFGKARKAHETRHEKHTKPKPETPSVLRASPPRKGGDGKEVGGGVTNVDRSSVTIKGGTVNLGGGGPQEESSEGVKSIQTKKKHGDVPQPMHSVIKIDHPIIQEINQPVIHRVVGGEGVNNTQTARGVANIKVSNLRSIYELAELTPDDIREGASFRQNLKNLYLFIKSAIEKDRVLPYHVIQEFERSPLNRIFVQTGIGLLNDDAEDRDTVFEGVARDIKKKFGDNLDVDEFEALIDFKDKLDQLI